MKKKLEQGITLVVDRYAFSGVAFTSAKPVSLFLMWRWWWCFSFLSYGIVMWVKEQQLAWHVVFSPGILSGLVQATWCGTAKARSRYVSTAEPCWGCSQRSVWRGEVWDQCFPKNSSTEIWAADEGSFSQLAGMSQVWIANLFPADTLNMIQSIIFIRCCDLNCLL